MPDLSLSDTRLILHTLFLWDVDGNGQASFDEFMHALQIGEASAGRDLAPAFSESRGGCGAAEAELCSLTRGSFSPSQPTIPSPLPPKINNAQLVKVRPSEQPPAPAPAQITVSGVGAVDVSSYHSRIAQLDKDVAAWRAKAERLERDLLQGRQAEVDADDLRRQVSELRRRLEEEVALRRDAESKWLSLDAMVAGFGDRTVAEQVRSFGLSPSYPSAAAFRCLLCSSALVHPACARHRGSANNGGC